MTVDGGTITYKGWTIQMEYSSVYETDKNGFPFKSWKLTGLSTQVFNLRYKTWKGITNRIDRIIAADAGPFPFPKK